MLDYKAIGRRIAHYRKKSFLTQEKLSEKLDFSESYMSQVERGKVKLSLQRLDQISEILNVNIELLISDVDLTKDNYGETPLYFAIRKLSVIDPRLFAVFYREKPHFFVFFELNKQL